MSLRDDFARWRDDPMTRQVLKALSLASDAQKQAWDTASWGGSIVRGEDLERMLTELRVRADAYRSLEEMSFEQLCQWLGVEDAE